MFHILGLLFIVIIAILIIGLSIIGTVIRSVFGMGKRRATTGGYSSYSGNTQQTNSSSEENTANSGEDIHPKRKKLFAKDEGEYVDYEEVKE